jgi:prepilin peptidase CpaA
MVPVLNVVALAVACVGCACDLRSRRIPNWLTFGAAAAALTYQMATAGVSGVGAAAAGWFVGAAIFFVPFALGGMGGGDVKLLAALGAWVGPSDALWLGLYTGAAGGVLALAVSLGRGYLREAVHNVSLLLMHWRVTGLRPLPGLTIQDGRGPKLAYGVSILVGTVVTIWTR